MAGEVLVTIEGLPPNPNEYDGDAFIRGDEELRRSIDRFWRSGARPEDIEDTLAGALTDAAAG